MAAKKLTREEKYATVATVLGYIALMAFLLTM